MKTNITNQCKQSLMVAKGRTNSCQSFSDYTQVFFTFRKINKAIGAKTLLLALFLVPLLAANTHAQLVVDTSAVNANFGIDAGLYSNQLSYGHPFLDNFGNIISPEDTDDWFYKSGGMGLGVIDTTGTQAIIDAIAIDNNYWFTKDISIPPLSVANGYFWIDAIYIRDNNSAGNNNDSSVFTGTSNKNTDNPTVWNLGVGATPQKNDIIDVYAHLRRDGPSPENTLWFFGGISTLSVDDNSYVDFEFFRENVQYSVSNGITNSGPDGGHTAWEFTNDSTSSIGDFIVSVNYTKGATLPDAHIRIWVHEDDVIAGRDIHSGTSVFTFNGVFNKGTDSGDYGYAEIIAPGLTPSAFIFANADGTSLAPPWGTLNTAGLGDINIATHYNSDQFLEIGINLTKLGLDAFFIEKQPGQECDQTLGSMIVKSRSLPSFTSELKDFAGPVQFGSEQEVTVSANKSGDIDCINACVQLFADSVSVGATYLWTGPNGYSDTTQNPVVCEPGEYVICATLSSGCSVCDTINIVMDQELSNFAISGPDDLCIDSSYTYSGPAGMDTYSWSISGDGTILGEDNEPTVEVMSGNICGGSFTLSLTITYGVCEGTSSATYSIGNTAPIFIFVPPDQTIQCHANIVFGTPIAIDNCNNVNITFSDQSTPPGVCPAVHTRTWTATNDCGNTTQASQTITITDTIAPELTVTCTLGDNGNLGCNPSADDIDGALGSGTANDNCGAVTVTFTDGPISVNGCLHTQTRTFTATDDCGNTASETRTTNWTVDTTDPVIIITCSIDNFGDLGCNPSADEIDDALGSATANNNCGAVTVTSTDGAVSINGCHYMQTRTFFAIDFCGNATSLIRTITWTIDNIDPIIVATGSVSNNGDLGCNPSADDIDEALGTATATDNCGSVTVTSTDGAISVNGCVHTQTRTFLATDFCGNNASVSRTINWTVDTIVPVIIATGSIPNNGDLGCNPSADDIDEALGSATATDNCSTVSVSTTDGAVSVDSCVHTQTRTFSSTDFCGNSAIVTRTVNWTVDTLAPLVIATGFIDNNGNLGCNPSTEDINAALGSATATNNCGAVTATATDGPVLVSSSGCGHTQTRTFSLTDECGNSSSVSRTINWTVDTIAPVIIATGSIPNNGDLGCNPSADDIDDALGSATATDNCGSVTVTSSDGAVSVNGCVHSQTRTFFATDFCGNTASVSRTINWTVDNIDPVIIATGSIDNNGDLGCNPSADDIDDALGSATATDNCGTVSVSTTDGSVSVNGCVHTQTRTFFATDFCGNTASVSRTINWTVDNIDPVIIASGSIDNNGDLGCNPSADDIDEALGSATATDNCGTVSVSTTDSAVSVNGCVHTQTRTFTATDFCGNTASVSRTINWSVDTIAPVIVATGSIDNNGDLGCNPSVDEIDDALGSATATDNCGTVSVTASDGAVSLDGCVHTQTRTFFATDFCGNTASVSRTINWTVDTLSPLIIATGSISNNGDLGCNPSIADINAALGSATATNNCGAVTVTASDGPVSVSSSGCVHSQTRLFSLTDLCGNSASVSRTISWTVDTIPPEILVFCPVDNNAHLGCNPSAADIDESLGYATATDNCGPVSVITTDGAVSVNGCTHTQTRTFSATDDCGNTEIRTRTINWTVDTIAPEMIVVCPIDNYGHLGCSPSAADIDEALGSATATDNCSSVSVITTDGTVSVNGCTHTQTRTFSATDDCGNTEIRTRTIYWTIDNIAPVITVGADTTIECTETPVFSIATVTDNCELNIAATYTDNTVQGNCANNYSITRTWTATDSCGNTSTASQKITVVDTTPPVLTCSEDYDVFHEDSIEFTLPTVFDACDLNVQPFMVSDTTILNVDGSKSHIRSWVAIDTCGNVSDTCSQTITELTGGYCTLTQEFYGNSAGQFCDGRGSMDLLNDLLDQGPMVIGGGSNTMTFSSGDGACIISRLPGGGPSAMLNGAATCNDPIGVPLYSNGTFENALLAQTITLGLNLRLDNHLANLELTGTNFTTVEMTACNDTSSVSIPGTEETFSIPQLILDTLGADHTVSDLYDLANLYLSGAYGNDVSLANSINEAISAINEGFEECRQLTTTGFFTVIPSNPDVKASVEVEILAYPNPSAFNVTIEFSVNKKTRVYLDVFSITGEKVATLYNGVATEDVFHKVEFVTGNLPSGTYIYRLQTEDNVITDRIIFIR